MANLTAKIFSGGVHPSGGKELSSAKPVKTAPLLDRYIVPVQQNIGAPPKLLVETGDTVGKGQKIAEAGSFVSVPLHSPTSGKVGNVFEIPGTNGVMVQAIEIISDGKDEWKLPFEPLPDWRNTDKDVLKRRILEAGIVGMGGASFPAHVKLSPPPEKIIDTLIVNGAECEPYLTCDHRLMLEKTSSVLEGAAIAAKILHVSRIFIGIEKNKPDAIEAMTKLAKQYGATVVPLKVKYPQGGEKQLIYAVTGRSVATGGLPMDVGCVVHNVGTCNAIYDAVVKGIPLIERLTTVTGTPVKDPSTWLFRIGTPVKKALELSGGIVKTPSKVILGGPMMGFAQINLEGSVMKNTSGILLLTADETAHYESSPCIRCGKCIDACPMKLLPNQLSKMIESNRFDLAEQFFVMDCMECGSCAFVCPAKRPLVQHMRRAKGEINAIRRARK